MSLESAIVERLSSRLSDVGRQRLPKCHAIAQEMFRAAWLSALGRGVPVCLADLAVQLADTFHVRVELVGARRYHKLDGAIVISNHLGAAKLIKTNRRQIELALPPTVRRTYPMTGRLLNSDSFLALFSPPVFASIFAFAPARLEFIPLSIQYDGSFGVIAEALGFMQLSARPNDDIFVGAQ